MIGRLFSKRRKPSSNVLCEKAYTIFKQKQRAVAKADNGLTRRDMQLAREKYEAACFQGQMKKGGRRRKLSHSRTKSRKRTRARSKSRSRSKSRH